MIQTFKLTFIYLLVHLIDNLMMCWIIHLILTLLAFRKFFTEPERAERRNSCFCVSWIAQVEATTVSIFRSGLVRWQKESKALFFSDVITVIKCIYWTNNCKSQDQTLSAQPWCCYHIFTECIIKKTPSQQIKALLWLPAWHWNSENRWWRYIFF